MRFHFGLSAGMSGNQLRGDTLSGAIPPELGGMASLRRLNLSGNDFRGGLPVELGSLPLLSRLDLSENQLVGQLPPVYGSIEYLRELKLSGNQLTGGLPPEYGSLGNLEVLDLQDNELTGEIPPEYDNLAFVLQELQLDGNQLSGCVSDLLRDFAPGSSGSLPVCTPENHAGDTETLVALHIAWGQPDLRNWRSREPIGEWQGVSVDSNGRVAGLKLADAELEGEFPPELGNLARLRFLNLESRDRPRNRLAGDLPAEWDNLTDLEVMYLGGIKLTGRMGQCLPNVVFSVGFSWVSSTGGLCVAGEEFASVSAGRQHNCGVMRGGSVACWGDRREGQDTPPAGEFASVSAGAGHTCGVRTNGTVACWGNQARGVTQADFE